MIDLNGQTALVTGAAKRLGRAIALALADAGVNVVAHYHRSTDDARTLADELATRPVHSHVLAADLADTTHIDDLFAAATDLAGPIDILINNASIFPSDQLADTTIDAIDTNLRINTFAPFVLSQCLFRQQRRAAIVNLLDARVADIDRQHAAYHLSKRMLTDLTGMMAVEFAPLVRANAVAPGLILPPVNGTDADLTALHHTNPLQTHGRPADITAAVLFLLRSDFITGQTLFVDGGRHIRGRLNDK